MGSGGLIGRVELRKKAKKKRKSKVRRTGGKGGQEDGWVVKKKKRNLSCRNRNACTDVKRIYNMKG